MTTESSASDKELPAYVFKTLIAHLKGQPAPEPPKNNTEEYPLFVTYTTKPDDDLRGCIGTFSSGPLYKTLANYAIIAAMRDTRFQPITLEEITELNVAVSLLVDFEPCSDPLDWEVGVHGIQMVGKSVFLPEVAAEQNWTKEETLHHLRRKAGDRPPYTEESYARLKFVRFKSRKIQLSYDEFSAMQ